MNHRRTHIENLAPLAHCVLRCIFSFQVGASPLEALQSLLFICDGTILACLLLLTCCGVAGNPVWKRRVA
jgi:hypothetical protein